MVQALKFSSTEPNKGEIYLRRIVGLSASEVLCRVQMAVIEVPFEPNGRGTCTNIGNPLTIAGVKLRWQVYMVQLYKIHARRTGAGVCLIQAPIQYVWRNR